MQEKMENRYYIYCYLKRYKNKGKIPPYKKTRNLPLRINNWLGIFTLVEFFAVFFIKL